MGHHANPKARIVSALERRFGNIHPNTAVKRLATDLYLRFRLTGPPFNPFEYAKRLGISVEFGCIEAEGVLTNTAALRRFNAEEQETDFTAAPEGMFTDNPQSGPRIVLRKPSESSHEGWERRRNFTLAHEIAHYVIRRAISAQMPTFEVDDPEEEMLCNTFAAELLMPARLLCDDLKHHGLSPDPLIYLHDRYCVSLQSLLCRVTDLYHGSLIAAIWVRTQGQPNVAWASPFQFRRLVLCDTGETAIERAFRSLGTETSDDNLLRDGERMRFHVVAKRLSAASKILSILYRRSDFSRRRVPLERRLFVTTGPGVPVQMLLPLSTANSESILP